MHTPRQLTAWFLILLGLGVSGCGVQPVSGDGEIGRRETVVVLHGLGRTKSAMRLLASRIEQAGFDVVGIGYDSLGEPPERILAEVSRQIDACCKSLPQPVHFVGHSLGGLVIRAYLAEHEVRSRGRVVLIATPNAGTPLVDAYRDSWWMNLAGPTARQLGTHPDSFPNRLPKPDYPVGVIAGVSQMPLLKNLLPGDHDGLVPIESARVDGMVDFIVVDSIHTFMRYDDEVAKQTIAFLRTGHFLQEQ